MYAIGVDIGGTKCAACLGEVTEGRVQILYKCKPHPTASFPPEEMLALLAEDIRFCRTQSPRPPEGIGISCGGPLDSKSGRILSPPASRSGTGGICAAVWPGRRGNRREIAGRASGDLTFRAYGAELRVQQRRRSPSRLRAAGLGIRQRRRRIAGDQYLRQRGKRLLRGDGSEGPRRNGTGPDRTGRRQAGGAGGLFPHCAGTGDVPDTGGTPSGVSSAVRRGGIRAVQLTAENAFFHLSKRWQDQRAEPFAVLRRERNSLPEKSEWERVIWSFADGK